MTPSDKITSVVVGDENSMFVEESVMSCLPFSSSVMFCSVGDENSCMTMIRQRKRQCPTVFYDSCESMVEDLSRHGTWIVFIIAGEVIHEDSAHFLWDFVMNHGNAYDALCMPIYDCSSRRIVEEVRVMSEKTARSLVVDRENIIVPGSCKLAPAGLFPKNTIRVFENFCVPEPAPSVLRRFEGRKVYSEICIRKNIRKNTGGN